MARTFAVDVLPCSTCQGRMKLLALVKEEPTRLVGETTPGLHTRLVIGGGEGFFFGFGLASG